MRRLELSQFWRIVAIFAFILGGVYGVMFIGAFFGTNEQISLWGLAVNSLCEISIGVFVYGFGHEKKPTRKQLRLLLLIAIMVLIPITANFYVTVTESDIDWNLHVLLDVADILLYSFLLGLASVNFRTTTEFSSQ